MQYLRSTTLKVDLLAGTDIRDACCDICELANRTGTNIRADFNGVAVTARPHGNPLELVDKYRDELKSDKPHKMVIA